MTQLHAISRVREIDHVIGFDNEPEVAASFADRVRFLDLDVDDRVG